MKVVVTGTRGIPGIMGGVEMHCEQLFPRVAALGADVTVVRRSSYAGDRADIWNGVHLYDIRSPRKKSLEAAIHTFRAVNYAASMHADILHVNAVGPALLIPYAKMRGLKVVFTHHGPDYDRQKWGRAAKSVLRLGEKLGCRYADEVIVISKGILDSIAEKHGRKENVTLINNGVQEPDFCSFPDYFRELGIEAHKYVLSVARFVPEKRLEDIIYAFRDSGLKTAGYRLVLAGDADFEDSYSLGIKKLAEEEDVVLTGIVKGRELHSLYSKASLFVMASSHEGLPIALLEAMSYGLPVVASDIPANLEVGLSPESYYRLGDTDELMRKISSAVNDGHRDYDMTKYNWDTIARRTMSVYRHCHEL